MSKQALGALGRSLFFLEATCDGQKVVRKPLPEIKNPFHSSTFHRSIAASSRSRPRRPGRALDDVQEFVAIVNMGRKLRAGLRLNQRPPCPGRQSDQPTSVAYA